MARDWVIETAEEFDFSEMTTFLDRAFRLPDDFFRLGMNHIYQPQEADRNWIVRDQGRIAGVFGIFPMTFLVGGIRIDAQGIGGVSADPALRGQGIMSAFLAAAPAALRQRGADISWLGGNRERYARSGWEHAGSKRWSQIDEDSPFVMEGQGVSRVDPREHAEVIGRLFNAMPLRTERTPEMMARQFDRPNIAWWLGDGAYGATWADKPSSVLELAGTAMGAENVLAAMRATSGGRLEVPTPNDNHPVSRAVRRLSSSGHLGQIGSLKIVDLPSLMTKLAPVMEQNLCPLQTQAVVNLAMSDPRPEDAGCGQLVSLRIDGGHIEVRRDLWPGPTLTLDRRSMSELIFGRWGEVFPLPAEFAILRHLLPVPLHVYQLDQV